MHVGVSSKLTCWEMMEGKKRKRRVRNRGKEESKIERRKQISVCVSEGRRVRLKRGIEIK